MLNKKDRICCDYCGQFISYDDLMNDKAIHQLETPLSEFTEETYESVCSKCIPQHYDFIQKAMQTIYGTSLVRF